MKNSKNPPLLLLHFYYRIAVQKTLKSSFLALHPIGNFQLPKTEKELKYMLQTKNSPYSYKTKPGSKTSFNYISNQSALDPSPIKYVIPQQLAIILQSYKIVRWWTCQPVCQNLYNLLKALLISSIRIWTYSYSIFCSLALLKSNIGCYI